MDEDKKVAVLLLAGLLYRDIVALQRGDPASMSANRALDAAIAFVEQAEKRGLLPT